MRAISVQEIQRDPRDFLQRIEAGEDIVVVRGTHPVAEVRPVHAGSLGPRPFGLCQGRFTVPKDFDQAFPEGVLEGFEGA